MPKVQLLNSGTRTTLRKRRTRRTDISTLRPARKTTTKRTTPRYPGRKRTRTQAFWRKYTLRGRLARRRAIFYRRRLLFKGRRPPLALLILAGLACLILFGGLITQTATVLINDHLEYSHKVHQTGPYILTGKPTIDADFINKVLAYYHSPAQGKGEALYNYGVEYHIDPAFALAFFMHESDLGTEGVARYTHSLGNIRATKGYAQYEGYRKYDTWEEGFEDWYRLIDQLYVQQLKLTTVNQIIPVYAPTADNNNEAQYISSVEYMVDTWRAGQISIT